jgi:hypothetical protein
MIHRISAIQMRLGDSLTSSLPTALLSRSEWGCDHAGRTDSGQVLKAVVTGLRGVIPGHLSGAPESFAAVAGSRPTNTAVLN